MSRDLICPEISLVPEARSVSLGHRCGNAELSYSNTLKETISGETNPSFHLSDAGLTFKALLEQPQGDDDANDDDKQ